MALTSRMNPLEEKLRKLALSVGIDPSEVAPLPRLVKPTLRFEAWPLKHHSNRGERSSALYRSLKQREEEFYK